MSFQDKTLTCFDCEKSFTFSAEEQEQFQSRGYMNEPKRCPECRRVARHAMSVRQASAQKMKRHALKQDGQGLVEYALILALVVITAIVILALIGPAVGNIFSNLYVGL